MIKRILLGLLLAPCLSNAMAPMHVRKLEGALQTAYRTDAQQVVRRDTIAGPTYTLSRYYAGSWVHVAEGNTAAKVFEKLEADYERQ